MTSKSKADYLAKYLSGDSKKKKKKASSNSLVIDQDDSLMVAPPTTLGQIDPQVTIRTASSVSQDPLPVPSLVLPDGQGDPRPAVHAINTVVIPKLERPRGRHDSDSEDDQGPPRRRMRYDSDSDDERSAARDPQSATRGGNASRAETNALSQGATTVHRDARGRKIAVADLKQEAVAAEQATVDKLNADKLFMMGRVQLEQVRERRRQLDEVTAPLAASSSGSAVGPSADPLRDRMRWGDPGAMLGLVEKQKAKMRDPDRPEYEGGWAPNRFMIPPGFRWDGIGTHFALPSDFFSSFASHPFH